MRICPIPRQKNVYRVAWIHGNDRLSSEKRSLVLRDLTIVFNYFIAGFQCDQSKDLFGRIFYASIFITTK